jgi:hypothetical protein
MSPNSITQFRETGISNPCRDLHEVGRQLLLFREEAQMPEPFATATASASIVGALVASTMESCHTLSAASLFMA